MEIPQFHFAENAFTLKLLFQSAEGLVYIVITYDDLHGLFRFVGFIFAKVEASTARSDIGLKPTNDIWPQETIPSHQK